MHFLMAGRRGLALNLPSLNHDEQGEAMARPTFRNLGLRIFGAMTAGALIGAFIGIASAQDRAAGVLDTTCSAECASRGFAADYCNRMCWIPDPAMAARGSMFDWKCMTDCRARGGSEEDCRPQCRRR
jgi:hypothetical protein